MPPADRVNAPAGLVEGLFGLEGSPDQVAIEQNLARQDARILQQTAENEAALDVGCQSALNFDPVSASNFDPFARRGLRVALGSSELAGIAETRRARVA